MYQPNEEDAPVALFLSSLDPRLTRKILLQILRLASLHPAEMREPHIKHFVLERYSALYELREKSKILIRIIFTISNGDIILLTPFIKRRKRDSEKALEQAVRILVDIRAHPECVVEFYPVVSATGT
jgi:hypothetical protein